MGMFLNSRVPFEACKAAKSGLYFVDKSALIGELVPAFGTEDRFYCITRPRRFGKTVIANRIGAFLSKAADAHDLFDDLAISHNQDYSGHLNLLYLLYLHVLYGICPAQLNKPG